MTIKMIGSSSGSVALDAPASTTGGANIEFKLPVADGTSGQAVVTDASGNLSFANVGKFASYAIIGDQKAYDTDGGTFTAGDWRTRDLNTEFADPDNIVSINSNQFTLQAGTYFIRATATAYKTARNVMKLQNITDATLVGVSLSYWLDSSVGIQGESKLAVRFTINGAKTFELQHRAAATQTTFGFGVAHDVGGFNSIFTIVEIFKEA